MNQNKDLFQNRESVTDSKKAKEQALTLRTLSPTHAIRQRIQRVAPKVMHRHFSVDRIFL